SEAESWVRVSAIQLIIQVPGAKKSLSDGEISLTNLAKAASSITRQEKSLNERLSQEQKEEVLTAVTRKSTREAELSLKEIELKKLSEKGITPPATVVNIQKIKVSDQVVKKILQLKTIKGNYSDSELIEQLIDQELKKIEEEKNLKTSLVCTKESPPVQANDKKNSRYIPKSLKEFVRDRANNRCEFVDTISGRRCTEVHDLHYDHQEIPFSCGGQSTKDNIFLKCPNHNNRGAIVFFGLEKMDPFINHQH
ncbi:MAG: hypothetical protein HQK49_11290, partial [Oligoflexia bacterium]|nr:hypothetical protein [Oligoflexia bacterium]